MIILKLLCFSVLLSITMLITITNGASTQHPQQSQQIDDYQNQAVRIVIRIYDECRKSDGGFTPCLKKKALTIIDRVDKIDSINIGDGVKIVRNLNLIKNHQVPITDNKSSFTTNDTELEKQLPRALEQRDQVLTTMLINKVTQFINGRTVQLTLPQFSSEELGRGLEEGRGKMKKMMGMMMMGFAMKMAGLVPIAIAGLFLLAGKALIISKIALLLAGIIGLKKLLASKQGGGGGGGSGHSSGWSSGGGGGGWSSGGGGGGGGGWDRRSNDDNNLSQNLAYKGYNTVQK